MLFEDTLTNSHSGYKQMVFWVHGLEGVQSRSPADAPCWHVTYFELKVIERDLIGSQETCNLYLKELKWKALPIVRVITWNNIYNLSIGQVKPLIKEHLLFFSSYEWSSSLLSSQGAFPHPSIRTSCIPYFPCLSLNLSGIWGFHADV